MSDSKPLPLKVLESHAKDVAQGIARITKDAMKSLGIDEGGVIEITGRRKTVAKCLPYHESKEDSRSIRIDGIVRNNAGMAIGDIVEIRKIKADIADKVTVAPLEAIPPIDERYIADVLESRPLVNGDNFLVPYFGGHLSFQVVDVNPSGVVIVKQKTIFSITSNPPTLIPTQEFVKATNYSSISMIIEDSVKQENYEDVYLVLRFHLTYKRITTTGEFQKKLGKESDIPQMVTRHIESAEQILRSINEQLLVTSDKEENPIQVLRDTKFRIINRWLNDS